MRFSSALIFTAITGAIALPAEVEQREVKKVQPMSYTSCGSLNDVLQVDSLTLDPNPAQQGNNTLKISGTLLEDVTEGAKITVKVKAGILTFFHKELDVCDLADMKSDLECPIKAGPFEIAKDFEIPSGLPHIDFKIDLSGTTADNKTLTCYSIDVGI
ncbi:phosphatidylglycerol/phosphatidylinositol transfer protein precursor [Venturia nashicola]|uniref:Phosphatidylglycerol/phosphatidylinositol transfer protein n=1 Tax=Venturia nashicola TaxID=86259 RepID=A0A4Z1PAV4_9PEZI|nr:phosphatidylglycerol/phosphatidylinositol transfer protein precursor [Venturia nashicola]